MATAKILGQTHKVLKDPNIFIPFHSDGITPLFNKNDITFSEVIPSSMFDFNKGDEKVNFFSLLKSIYKGKQEVFMSTTSELIDPTKTQILFNSDGTFSIYNEDFEKLAQDEVAEFSFSYLVENGKDSSTQVVREVTIEVTGTNEAPEMINEEDQNILEDKILSNQLIAYDIDSDDDSTTLTYHFSNTNIPGFSFNADGNYSLDASIEHYQSLAFGETQSYSFNWKAEDSHAAFSNLDEVKLTITGINDTPTIASPLTSITHEELVPYTIDLLDGASDIDNNAILHIANVKVKAFKKADGITESFTLGGYNINGDSVTINQNHFDELNDDEWGQLLFNYDIVDEHGAIVEQSLTVDIEGYTDAPSIEVITSAGDKVNTLLLQIKSEPARDEKVQLRFDKLSSNARVYDTNGNDVTNGIANFYTNSDYLGDHLFTLIMNDDVLEPVDITVAGIETNGTVIGENIQTVELLYDKNISNTNIAFTNVDQSMWGNFDFGEVSELSIWEDMQDYGLYVDLENLNFQFHEYYPMLGNDFMQWDKQNGWQDTGAEYWRSGEFNVVDINYSSIELNTMIAAYAQDVIDGAKEVFDTTAYVVDAGVQATFNAAQLVYDTAKQTFYNTAYAIDTGAKATFDAAKLVFDTAYQTFLDTRYLVNSTEKAIYDAAHYAFYETATTARDVAHAADFLNVLTDEINAAYELARGVWNTAADAYQAVKDGIYSAAEDIYNAAIATYNTAYNVYEGVKQGIYNAAEAIFDTAQDVYDGAKLVYDTAKAAVEAAAQVVYDGVSAGIDNILSLANTIDVNSEITVDADLFARAGLQLDFILDAGSVDTDVQYKLTSVTEYNQSSDQLAITPSLYNLDDDTLTPFSTVSPNASIYAALLYDVGADLDLYIDGSLAIADYPIFDLGGINFSPTISTTGANYMFEYDENGIPYIAQLDEVKSYQDMMDEYGIEIDLGLPENPGELVILDLDSKDAEAVAVPGLDDLTKGIIEKVEVKIPTVETEAAYVSEQDVINAITNSYSYQLKDLFGVADDPLEQTFGENIDDYYFDEAIDEASDIFEVVNLEQLTSAFENATIELGEKVTNILNTSTAFISEYGSLDEFVSEAELDEIILGVAMGMAENVGNEFLDFIDGQYETGTIIMVDLTNTTSEALFHYNTWDFNTDKLIQGLVEGNLETALYDYQSDIDEDTASLGLYASSGESDPFVSITIDVDAIAAVVISQILKKVATAASAGAASVLEAIPDELLNPFEQKLGLETLLKIAEVPAETVDQITDFLNLEYTYTRVDADVIASADFSQDFTLTVDDMSYIVTMEDETVFSFSASDADNLVIESAAEKFDVDGDGIVEYDLQLVPTAMFSNDTELGLNLGLELDFLAAALEAKIKLPLAELLDSDNPNSLWPTLEVPIDYSFGPLLEIDWAMNGLDIDVYESRFEMDIGTETIEDNKIDVQLVGVQDQV
ncbi:MAG: hypothetical protein HQL46_00750 [Gammaproteobacteria bacterium]|nr:hypothetical protein [Gammaproteobacteria bacterium]